MGDSCTILLCGSIAILEQYVTIYGIIEATVWVQDKEPCTCFLLRFTILAHIYHCQMSCVCQIIMIIFCYDVLFFLHIIPEMQVPVIVGTLMTQCPFLP